MSHGSRVDPSKSMFDEHSLAFTLMLMTEREVNLHFCTIADQLAADGRRRRLIQFRFPDVRTLALLADGRRLSEMASTGVDIFDTDLTMIDEGKPGAEVWDGPLENTAR